MTSRLLRVLSLATLLALAAAPLTHGGAAAAADRWARLRFLLGTWSGEGVGGPGAGSGGSTFALDLDGHILVRRNHAEYPADRGRAAFSHQDLLVVYPRTDSTFRAFYFDNEGHVIEYRVSFGDSGQVFFDSEQTAVSPRFRLSYRAKADGTLEVDFETAPQGAELRPYLTGTLRRVPEARE